MKLAGFRDSVNYPDLAKHAKSRMYLLSVCCFVISSFHIQYTYSLEINYFGDVAGDCSWCSHVVAQSRLHCEPISKVTHEEMLTITDRVLTAARNLAPGNSQSSEEYKSFPYALRVEVLCDGEISYIAARYFAGSGVVPRVIIQHRNGDGTNGILQHIFNGALVDLQQLELDSDVKCNLSDSQCNEDLCKPAWIVPLPFDNQTQSLHVRVSSDGFELLPQAQRYTINSIKFMAETSSGNSEGKPILNVKTIKNWHVPVQLPSVVSWDDNTPTVLIGPPDTNIIIFSRNQFDSFDILRVNVSHNATVCNISKEESLLLSALGQPDRILLGTSIGLLDMTDEIEYVNILPVCIKALVAHLYRHSGDQTVLAIAETGLVYSANINKGEFANFTLVSDWDHMSVCDFIAEEQGINSENCTVISATIDPTQPNHHLLLLCISNANGSYYHLMEHSGDTSNGTWSFLSQISSAQFTSGPPVNGCNQLQWTGISYTSMVTQNLFIWGQSLIQSTDSGKTLHMMSAYPIHNKSSIIAFTSSQDGSFAILNQLQEVWYGRSGDLQSLIILIPSSTWTLMSTLHHFDGYDADLFNITTMTVFFDGNQDLYQLIAYQALNEAGFHVAKHQIPVSDIIAGENFQTRFESMMDNRACSGQCPFSEIQFEALSSQYYSRIQKLMYQLPCLAMSEQVYNADALLVYQGLVYQVLHQHENYIQVYADPYYDPLQDWRENKRSLQDYHAYLYRNHLTLSDVFVPLDQYYKMYEEDFIDNRLPRTVYLDRDMIYEFSLRVSLDENQCAASADPMMNVQLEVDVSDQELIRVISQRQANHLNNTVTYQVTLQTADKDSYVVSQFSPRPVTVTLQLWNSNFKCISDSVNSGKELQGSNSLTAMIGCPVGRQLIFDLQKSLDFLSEVSEVNYDCPQPDPLTPCIYYGNGFYPHFYIQDQVTGQKQLFTGNYTFDIIAGGLSVDKMTHYTASQVDLYNTMDRMSTSMVWISHNATAVSGRIIFSFDCKAIHWHCQANSPCADVPLNFPYGPEYYFLIHVTNRDVDFSTYCEYSTKFVLKIHGFRPSFYTSYIVVGVSLAAFLAYLLVYFICKREDEYVLKEFKKRVLKQKIHPEEMASPSPVSGSEYSSDEEILHISEASPSVTFSEHVQHIDAWRPRQSQGSVHSSHTTTSSSLHKSILKKRLSTDNVPE